MAIGGYWDIREVSGLWVIEVWGFNRNSTIELNGTN